MNYRNLVLNSFGVAALLVSPNVFAATATGTIDLLPKVDSHGNKSITVNWTNNELNVDRYRVCWRKVPGVLPLDICAVNEAAYYPPGGLSTGGTYVIASHKNKSLELGATYSVKVFAWNGGDWVKIEGKEKVKLPSSIPPDPSTIPLTDKYISGNFDGALGDELLAVNPNGWHQTMRFDGSSWQFVEGDGSGKIYWWSINADDKYVSADFNGDGRAELLAVNPNGWHHTIGFDGSSWQFVEGDGSGTIYWWEIGRNDKYTPGDFNGDGSDDLLAVNPNGWHHTMAFNGSSWSYLEGEGDGRIHWWSIN